MAQLTPDEWLVVRNQWETSLKGGYAWLTQKGGGPWDVSGQRLRAKALSDGWQKADERVEHSPEDLLRQRREAAEVKHFGRSAYAAPNLVVFPGKADNTDNTKPKQPPQQTKTVPKSDPEVEAERERLLAEHKSDIRIARAYVRMALSVAAEESRNGFRKDLPTSFEMARTGDLILKSFKTAHELEEKKYGLAVKIVDLDSMSPEELLAIKDDRRR